MQQQIESALKHLKNGNLILYPTDTVWGIGCDATNEAAIAKIYSLKKRIDSKALICLVADDRMLDKYVQHIPEAALNIIEIAEKPTTIIYDRAQNLAKNLIANDGSIAIRVPNEEFCYQLIRKFGGAIVSTSANISGEPTPKQFSEISPDILKGVSYVVNLHREKSKNSPSTIIKLSNDGLVKIIRN